MMNKIKHEVVISCFSSSNRKMRLSMHLTFPSLSIAIREPYQGPSRSSRNRIPKITCQFYWCYCGLYKTKIPKNNKYVQKKFFFWVNESTRKWRKAHRNLMEFGASENEPLWVRSMFTLFFFPEHDSIQHVQGKH